MVDVFSGDEIPALERICAIFDWYFDDVSLAAARKSTTDRSMLNSYLSKLNLIQTLKRGTTYLDYIKQQIDHPIETKEDLEEYRKNDNKVSDRDIKRWGLGFKPDEYAFLKDHYNMLKDLAGPDDIVTDNLIRDLCVIKVQTNRALADGETDKYAKMTELYQKTLTTANLKPKGSKDTAAVTQIEGIDMAIRDIEKYTPAEFFKDKALYKDHDGIGEYFMRFIVRPFKNLFTGSKEMDSEYSVTASQDGGDADASP